MKIRELLTKYFDAIETILVIGFAAGLMMLLRELDYAFLVIKISLFSLAALYWSKALEKTDAKNTIDKISGKITWYSLIIAPLAIISKLQFNENANIFLIFSLSLLIFAFIFLIYKKIKTKQKLLSAQVFRIFIAIILSFWLFTLPLPKIL